MQLHITLHQKIRIQFENTFEILKFNNKAIKRFGLFIISLHYTISEKLYNFVLFVRYCISFARMQNAIYVQREMLFSFQQITRPQSKHAAKSFNVFAPNV
jgi:hypothetical protein